MSIPVISYSCPLSSKISTGHNSLTSKCHKIIESARHIWGYYSPEYQSLCYEYDTNGKEVPKKFPPYSTLKLTSARSIQSWYSEPSDLKLTSQKTSEVIKKEVQDVRRFARPGIESDVTDKEILAIFAICEAFEAIHNIQRGKSEDAIKEKILTASTFLKLAKAGLKPATQDKAKQDKFVPFPTPSGTQWSEVKISFIDTDNVKISARKKTETRHYSGMGFKGKGNKPSLLWGVLKRLAQLNGQFTNYPDKEKVKTEKDFSDLRRVLKQLFKINGNPILYKKTKDYTGYKTAFVIEDKSYAREHEETVREHLREYIPPKKTHLSCKDENENDNEDNDNDLDD